jgi:Carboxypeptidase regulatory-like domain
VHPPRDRTAKAVGCALALLAAAGGVRAHENLGTLMGTVFDASTALPVAAAVVTATSPQLIGKQVVTSDATGTFWLPQLPPGVYTVSVAAEKFQDRLCLDIALNADQTLRIKVNLIPEGVAVMGIIVPCPD